MIGAAAVERSPIRGVDSLCSASAVPSRRPGTAGRFRAFVRSACVARRTGECRRERIDPIAVEPRPRWRCHRLRRAGPTTHSPRARARTPSTPAMNTAPRSPPRRRRRHAPERTLLLGQPAHWTTSTPSRRRDRPGRLLPRGQVDAARDEVAGAFAVAGTNLFDHAIRRRLSSFVRQWPTCGFTSPLLQMYASTSRNALDSSGGISVSVRPHRPPRRARSPSRARASSKRGRARPRPARRRAFFVSAGARANSSPSWKS